MLIFQDLSDLCKKVNFIPFLFQQHVAKEIFRNFLIFKTVLKNMFYFL